MKRNNVALWALLIALALLLSGCALAREEMEPEAKDRFVGLNILIESGDNYTDRNEPHELDGQSMYCAMVYDENGEHHVGSDLTECFANAQLAVNVTDEESEYSMSAELYIYPEQIPRDAFIRCEHIYQRSDGSLYAINTGNNFGGILTGWAYKVSESYSATAPDGTISGETISLHVKIVGCVPSRSATLIEMDDANTELRRQPLDEESYVSVSTDASWVLVEEHLLDGTTRRTAMNAPFDQSEITTYLEGEQGLCLPKSYYVTAE